MTLPLEDRLVVTLEQAVAAPYCSCRLADAGARVIKLERPEGDFARAYDKVAAGESTYFVWLNRGKQSVVCDLAKPQDKALFEALLAKADVFIQNLKPGSLARLGLPIGKLRQANPRLIACSITGYGETGPMADRKAYDMLIQAESGLAAITGGPEAPARVGISIVDIMTGAQALSAILEALILRERSGEGAEIAVSMFDATVDWMAVPFMHAAAGKPPGRIGLKHPSVAPYGVFRSCDGRNLLISIQNEREWGAFCRKVVDDPEFDTDARFKTNVARCANRAVLDERVQAGFGKRTHAELVERLEAAEIAFASVTELPDLLVHPQLRTTQVMTQGGPVTMPAVAAQWHGAAKDFGPVPALGAHTEKVRREFLPG
ncbi:MAG: CoA transferase [Hyphomicrobiaceae bacterium]|nr:MAG: CoA transferase [Hyphomicrobiaceae bacterium]